MKKIKVLDLFSGCGGFSCGFDNGDFEVIAANDIWGIAGETYQKNHKETKFFLGTITDKKIRNDLVTYCKRTGCDVILGGPPCQAYSMSGARDVDDSRGHLFEDYVEVVKKIGPKVFVMENVKGILTMQLDKKNLPPEKKTKLEKIKILEKKKSSLMLKRKQSKNTSKIKFTKKDDQILDSLKKKLFNLKKETSMLRDSVPDLIIRSFKKIGYNVSYQVLNAADFGTPQKRERVFFIGIKGNGRDIAFPDPTHMNVKIKGLNGDLFKPNLKPWKTTRQSIDDLKNKPENPKLNHVFANHSTEFIKRISKTPIGKSVYGNYSDSWYRNPADEPSRTVKENHGGVMIHYEKDRTMTPRELARLQSFDDNFIFYGSKSDVLVQIGNAVPPMLASAIARTVKDLS